jgi:hypothetical protein
MDLSLLIAQANVGNVDEIDSVAPKADQA